MKILNFLLILGLVATLFINYNVVLSHNLQNQLLTEFNSNNFTENTTASFGRLELEYPNISVTTLPIKQLVAKYYFLSWDYQKALKLIEDGVKANPYIRLGSSMKAEIYDHLKIKDSFLYYAKDAFEYSPKNSRHFFQYLKALTIEDQDSLMIQAYNKIKNDGNYQYQRTFLAAIMTLENKSDTLITLAKEAIKMFPNNEEIKLLSDNISYGQENILKSIEYSKSAKEFYKKNNLGDASSNWEQDQVALTVSATPVYFDPMVETFTISLSNLQSNSASMNLIWEHTLVPISIVVPTASKAQESIDKTLSGEPKAGDYYQAAVYYLQENKDLKKAQSWMEKALEMREKPAYWMYRQYALILAKRNDKNAALKAVKKSLALAEKAGNKDYVLMNKASIAEWSK